MGPSVSLANIVSQKCEITVIELGKFGVREKAKILCSCNFGCETGRGQHPISGFTLC